MRLTFALKRTAVTAGLFALVAGAPAFGAQVNVAVAANFTEAAKAIAAGFKSATGHDAILSFGSSGQLFAQITQGAPFKVFLSADAERPEQAVKAGLAVAESRFTYAIGRVVLWSEDPALVKGPETLKIATFSRIAIANPAAAPYGVAGLETLKALGVHDALRGKIVLGASIAQTLQFVDTGNAELGFVALAQLVGREGGSRWEPPQSMYTPIRQDAVLLTNGRDDAAAKAFIGYLRGPDARKVIAAFGYAVD